MQLASYKRFLTNLVKIKFGQGGNNHHNEKTLTRFLYLRKSFEVQIVTLVSSIGGRACLSNSSFKELNCEIYINV